jgi:hypothetical protein
MRVVIYIYNFNMGTIARATRRLQAPQLVAKEQARSGRRVNPALCYTESIVFSQLLTEGLLHVVCPDPVFARPKLNCGLGDLRKSLTNLR